MTDVARIVLRALAAVLLTLAGAIVVPSSMACACSCAQVSTDEAMANSTAVFDGVVVAHSQPLGGSSAEQIEYTIDVTRVYKGGVPARVIVRSAVSGASCGAELVGEVTVFAQGSIERLSTTLCSAPSTLDRSRLGAGSTPTPAPPAPPAPVRSDVGLPVWGIVAGLVVLGGAGVWLLVRRARGRNP